MKKRTLGRWRAVGWIAVWVCVAGCADLEPVRRLAARSGEIAGMERLIEEYPGSVERQKRYQPEAEQAVLDRLVKERRRQMSGLRAVQRGVARYLRVLEGLAGGGAVEAGVSEALGEGVRAIPGVRDRDVGAHESLAGLVERVVLEGWRRREIGRLVGEADEPMQRLCGMMATFLGEDLVTSLDAEEAALDLRYGGVLAEAERSGNGAAAGFLLREGLRDRRESIEAKRTAARMQAAAWRRLAEAHRRLHDRRGEMTRQATLEEVARLARELGTIYERIGEMGGMR